MPVAQIITYCELEDLKLDDISIEMLEEIYPNASVKYKTEKKFKEKAQETNKLLTSGDKVTLKNWGKISDITISALRETLAMLHHDFDYWWGESTVNDLIPEMLKNLEKNTGKVEFNAPLVVTAPTYNIIDELKEEGDWEILQKYSGFEFNDNNPKSTARTEYKNMMYLERPGCNLCMGNQEKAEKGDTVMATSTRLFKGRVVADSDRKKGESLLASTPVVVLSSILGRTPTMKEYIEAVVGINLTKFAPPKVKMCA